MVQKLSEYNTPTDPIPFYDECTRNLRPSLWISRKRKAWGL